MVFGFGGGCGGWRRETGRRGWRRRPATRPALTAPAASTRSTSAGTIHTNRRRRPWRDGSAPDRVFGPPGRDRHSADQARLDALRAPPCGARLLDVLAQHPGSWCILAGGVTSFQVGEVGAAKGVDRPRLGCSLSPCFRSRSRSPWARSRRRSWTAGGLHHWASILGGRGFGWVTAGFVLLVPGEQEDGGHQRGGTWVFTPAPRGAGCRS